MLTTFMLSPCINIYTATHGSTSNIHTPMDIISS